MASLGLVSPGAATDGVTPIFSWKKLTTFFCSPLSLFWISLGCHPLKAVTPDLFLPVRRRLSTVLCEFSHNFFFIRMSPLEGVTGAVRSPLLLVTPLLLFHILFKLRDSDGLMHASLELQSPKTEPPWCDASIVRPILVVLAVRAFGE